MLQTNRLIEILNKDNFVAFNNFNLTNENLEFIKNATEIALSKIPQKAFNCTQLSALLGAIIYDNSDIPIVVMSGHLDYLGKRIFNCKTPIPFSNARKTINEHWDGHCWVEIPNFIIDNSFFRTVYYGDVPLRLKNEILNQFGKGKGTIIATVQQMNILGFNYTPCFEVNQSQINGIIKSI